MRWLQVLAAAAAAGALASAAQATQTITFDDLPDTVIIGGPIPTTYAGLQWDNFFLDSGPFSCCGFQSGVVSGDFAASNGFGLPATIRSSRPFGISDFYITGGFDEFEVEFDAYLGGVLLGGGGALVEANATTHVVFPDHFLPRVDELQFISSDDGLGFSGDRLDFVLDNLTITSVPEPAAWALLIVGFGAAGARLRARRRPVPA